VELSAGAFSDPGRVRDNNEDAYVVDERLTLFAVADGMGGHLGGEVASWTAIEALRAAVANRRAINVAITEANEAVRERASGDPNLTGMGTTMTAVVVAGGRVLLIGHVGDSRAYLLHDGSLRRVTDDHSLVEELVREGRLTPEQAESHPHRAVVTRALGVDEEVDVDLFTVEVAQGDRLVLCSDGLTTMVRERDVERIVAAGNDPQRTAEALVDAANEAGGTDNTTVIVLDVVSVDDDTPIDPLAFAEVAKPVTPVAVPAPDVEAPEPTAPKPKRSHRVRSILLVALPLLAIVLFAVGVAGWYARRSYYVGFAGDTVVIYKGVPGGFAGWDPTVEERTDLTRDDLEPIVVEHIDDGAAKGSRGNAEAYIASLEQDVADATSTTTSSTTTSTSTTSTTTTTTTTTVAPVAPPPS
jgi:protein phosphatase